MSSLRDYENKFRNIRLERRDGILQVSVHTDGGPLKWGALEGSVHDQLGEAFFQIGRDGENRVVIFTGTGTVFCTEMNFAELPTQMNVSEWQRLTHEGRDLVMAMLDIDVPVIAAVNGPAHIHAQLPVLADMVLAAEHAEFADLAHFPSGVVPGDSAQVVWPMLLGPNRGRQFLLTGQRIGAQEALALGFVAQVLPAAELLPRAWALAREWVAKPRAALRHTRATLVQPIKRRMLDELDYGLTLEGFAMLDR